MITVTERIVEDFGEGYALVEVVAECPLNPEDDRILENDEPDDPFRHSKRSLEVLRNLMERQSKTGYDEAKARIESRKSAVRNSRANRLIYEKLLLENSPKLKYWNSFVTMSRGTSVWQA